MFFHYKEKIEEFLFESVRKIFGIKLENVILNSTPQVSFGEFSSTFPFQLAKILKKNPFDIACKFVNEVERLKLIENVPFLRKVGAEKGYVNFYLKRKPVIFKLLEKSISDEIKFSAPVDGNFKIIVEHTNINPNKAAHVGHLRNSILGDTLVRLLRALGFNVEVQNYIDNTGVQVADIVVGLKYLKGYSLEEVIKLSEDEKFDYFCWDLYTEVGKFYEENEENLKFRRDVLKEIESGDGEIFKISEAVSLSVLKAHLKTMKRLGIFYDLLPRESDILHLKFWERAFTLLKEKGVISFESEGANKGCWVFKYNLKNGKEDSKIIVRSNGTVTYTGKDIAYQLWKFGKLGIDFFYKRFHMEDYPEVFITTSISEENEPHPQFGNGDMVFNVIDVRQSYTQNIVYEALKKLGFTGEFENSVHFSYEMVALSVKCAEELGFKLSSEEKSRKFVEVSGRKGLGVKADDLMNELEKKALVEVERRDLGGRDKLDVSKKIAAGALRYFMLKFAKNSLIVFDMEDALNFEGETGPYLQYSVVRAKNILRKYCEKYEISDKDLLNLMGKVNFEKIINYEDIWELFWDLVSIEEIAYQSFKKREISILAKKIFSVAQKFSAFYSNYRIIDREDREEREELLSFVYIYLKVMEYALKILGIPLLERM